MQVTREPLRAWVSGRWRRRRARVTESASALTAERVYEQLIREGRTTAPVGFGGRISWTIPSGPMWEIAFERTRNQVWALGRLFLLCPRCQRRATRLYVPSVVARPECRRCWGLTYSTRTKMNYKRKPAGWLSVVLGISMSEWARMETAERRRKKQAEARARYRERRAFFTRATDRQQV
jgi:hypothetical protein